MDTGALESLLKFLGTNKDAFDALGKLVVLATAVSGPIAWFARRLTKNREAVAQAAAPGGPTVQPASTPSGGVKIVFIPPERPRPWVWRLLRGALVVSIGLGLLMVAASVVGVTASLYVGDWTQT